MPLEQVSANQYLDRVDQALTLLGATARRTRRSSLPPFVDQWETIAGGCLIVARITHKWNASKFCAIAKLEETIHEVDVESLEKLSIVS